MAEVAKQLKIGPKVSEDRELCIATGTSRTTLNWANEKVLWSSLLFKLTRTVRTPETMSEYHRMSKADKDKTKDVGGFVGGSLRGGRRKADTVIKRSLITLDMDYADPCVWETIDLNFDCACVIYPTHSSTPENPRYRLIIPLDRDVDPDEYQAIARRIAGKLGIDMFDDTTYQPSRLMYWASTSCDAEFDCKYQDGPFLVADEILAEYDDWRDISFWNFSDREKKDLKRKAGRQQDPTEKKGIIGAFCRAYTIQEAIDTFLADVYEPCDVGSGDRYTYVSGSTSGGLVCYDDKFCYSNHATDPANGTLCNAFDIVRLHKFLEEYEDETEDRAKRLSMRDMRELAKSDVRVKRQLGEDALEDALGDFDIVDPDTGEILGIDNSTCVDTSWAEGLEFDDEAVPANTINNIYLILCNDPRLKGKVIKNAFSDRYEVRGALPWDRNENYAQIADTDVTGLSVYLETTYGMKKTQNNSEKALMYYLDSHYYNPVEDYLDGLEWDGVERLDTLFIDFLGAEDNGYVRAVTRAEMIAAVKRVYEPGCKFDETIILVGEQGVGKSTIIEKLAVRDEWFANVQSFTGKEAQERLRGKWLMEMSELSAFKKSEVEGVKAFLSTRVDHYRPAYGHFAKDYPRSCVFFGTTNDDTFLRDTTGNRRFYPISIGRGEGRLNVWDDMDEEYVGQIWAEAKFAYELGEETVIRDEEVLQKAREEQDLRVEDDGLFGQILEYVDMPVPLEWNDMPLCDKKAYIEVYRNGNLDDAENGKKDKNDTFIDAENREDDKTDAKNTKTKVDRICARTVFYEILGRPDNVKLNRLESIDINKTLRELEKYGWKPSKTIRFNRFYGRQRGYVRGI